MLNDDKFIMNKGLIFDFQYANNKVFTFHVHFSSDFKTLEMQNFKIAENWHTYVNVLIVLHINQLNC